MNCYTRLLYYYLLFQLALHAKYLCNDQQDCPKSYLGTARSPHLVAYPLIAAVHNRSTVFTRRRQCARPSNTRFLGPTTLIVQRAVRLVQPFFGMTDAKFSLYALHCAAHLLPPKLLLAVWGSGAPICDIIHRSMSPPDPSSQTDRQT